MIRFWTLYHHPQAMFKLFSRLTSSYKLNSNRFRPCGTNNLSPNITYSETNIWGQRREIQVEKDHYYKLSEDDLKAVKDIVNKATLCY